ncbi:MAG: hypothetical protein B6I24_04985 [Bacteroidetes bacterium 4572_128]|nr:MAG: hypothetical protein B6I24_04985 [Bacteroidetes bacterium 4572_128]
MKIFNIFFIVFFLFFLQKTSSQEEKKEFVRTLKGHTYRVNSVSFSPNGKYIISGSWDETLKLWQTESGEEIRTFKGYEYRVNAVDYSPDGEFVISGTSDNTFKLWRIQTGEIIRIFKGHKSNILALAFSPDGNYIVSGSADNTLRLWDRREGKKIKKYKGHSDYVNDVDFSPDGEYFASASDDKTIKIWETSNKYSKKTLYGHKSFVTDIEFSPDGRYLISASADKNLILWDVDSGDTIRVFRGHTNKVNAVTFSSNGSYIASAGCDTTVRVWETEKGRLLGTFTGHQAVINCVQFSQNGKYVVSGSDDTNLKLWDYSNLLITYSGYDEKVKYERELTDLFAPKDEFETLEQYEERLKRAELFTLEMYEKYRQIEDDSLELIALKEQNRLFAEELARRKQAEIDSIADRMRMDEELTMEIERAQKEELSRRENIKKSFENIYLKIDEIARDFKQNLQDVEVIGDKQLLEDCETFDIFNIKIIHPRTGVTYAFGKQKRPLYLEAGEMAFTLENENATHPDDKWATDEEEENYEEENNKDTIVENEIDTLENNNKIEAEILVKEDELFKVEYKFIEPSMDNILNAKEEGNLQITITNKSEIELKKLKIKLSSKDAHKALKYDKSAIFKKLASGETDVRVLKIKASKKIIDGTFNFNVTFEEKDDNLPQGFTLTITTSEKEASPISTSEDESTKEDIKEKDEEIKEEVSKDDKRPILEMKIVEFIDDGRDNILNAKEEGKLILTIKNTSGQDLKKIKLIVETENVSKNLKYKNKITIKKILTSGNHTEKIDFKAGKKIETTEVKIKISIEENENYKGEAIEFNISTKAKE